MTELKRPSSAEVTPPTPEAARSIRKEITGVGVQVAEAQREITDLHQIAEILKANQATLVNESARLRQELGPLFDAMEERIRKSVEAAFGRAELTRAVERKADAGALAARFVQERVDRNDAIEQSETRQDLKIDALRNQVRALSDSLGDLDARDIKIDGEVSKVHDLARVTKEELRVFTRGRVGFGLGSAAIAIAAKSGVTPTSVLAWATKHALVLSLLGAAFVFAAVVEIYVRLKRKANA